MGDKDTKYKLTIDFERAFDLRCCCSDFKRKLSLFVHASNELLVVKRREKREQYCMYSCLQDHDELIFQFQSLASRGNPLNLKVLK